MTRDEIRLQLGHPSGSSSARIRAQLGHPVIDSDGHILEFEPAVLDFLRQIAGQEMVDRWRATSHRDIVYGNHIRTYHSQFLSLEQRRDEGVGRAPWWGVPTRRTFDRAAACLPGLLYDCLEETGIDFSVLYPTLGLYTMSIDDDELRPAACRAVNMYNAAAIGGYGDRLTGVAVIPMNTPEEAIAELDHAVKDLKFKAVVLQSFALRPVPKIAREHPAAARYTAWFDNFCLDSLYDYDPVWAKCVELGVSPTFHTPNYTGTRSSPSNWMHNHIGVFAAGGESAARALFFGGVPHRFPSLRFAFLEGGAGWGTTLYSDIIGHWSKRNRDVIHDYDPQNLDRALFLDLHRRYGGPLVESRIDRVGASELNFAGASPQRTGMDLSNLDEFAASGVETREDIKRLFVDRFYFGCEADDGGNASAFNDKVNPMGAKLKAVLSSDIGHFDVPDITEVLEEAYELVEHGIIGEDDFRAFTFENPASLWTAATPDFFAGTAVEAAVAKLSGAPARPAGLGGARS